MKKIDKLSIKSENLIEDKDLLTLRGGYNGMLYCHGGDGPNCQVPTAWCDDFGMNSSACDIGCPGWDWLVCIGG